MGHITQVRNLMLMGLTGQASEGAEDLRMEPRPETNRAIGKRVKQVTYYFRCPSCLWGGRQGYTVLGPPLYDGDTLSFCPACGSQAILLGEVE